MKNFYTIVMFCLSAFSLYSADIDTDAETIELKLLLFIPEEKEYLVDELPVLLHFGGIPLRGQIKFQNGVAEIITDPNIAHDIHNSLRFGNEEFVVEKSLVKRATTKN